MTAQTVTAIPDPPFNVIEIDDTAYGLQGFVVIHSSFTHRGRGGVRIYPDVTRREVELLARGMTYKYCFHNIAIGGAKGGIRLPHDLSPDQRRALLRRFGSHIRYLIWTETFMPSTDMNCSAEDVAELYRGAGIVRDKIRRGGRDSFGSGEYTALSTMAGIVAAAKHLDINPPDCRVTVEGFGSVGRQLAREIDRWGGRIIGVSNRYAGVANSEGLDVARLLDVSAHDDNWPNEATGDWETIATRDLFALSMNIHVPGARVQSVDVEVADMLRCAAVVPAANAPCSSEGSQRLRDRSIMLLPFFVTNSGGIVSFRLRLNGMNQQAMRHYFEHDFTDMLLRMLRTAEGQGRTPVEVAMDVSTANYNKLSQQLSGRSLTMSANKAGRQSGAAGLSWPFKSRRPRRPADLRTDNIPESTAACFR